MLILPYLATKQRNCILSIYYARKIGWARTMSNCGLRATPGACPHIDSRDAGHFSFRASDNAFQRATPLSTSTRSLQGGRCSAKSKTYQKVRHFFVSWNYRDLRGECLTWIGAACPAALPISGLCSIASVV